MLASLADCSFVMRPFIRLTRDTFGPCVAEFFAEPSVAAIFLSEISVIATESCVRLALASCDDPISRDRNAWSYQIRGDRLESERFSGQFVLRPA